jgi:TetR/AcrR family fatty acid metabolism transcriptional regulator
MSTPHRLLKEQWRKARAELILDRAAEIFAEKGYYSTTVDEIAAGAGVAKGTLYQHFPSKDALVVALFERNVALLEQTVAEVAEMPLAARTRLERVFHYVYLERGGPHTQLLHLFRYTPEVRQALIKQPESLNERLDQVAARIGMILEEGKVEGTFDPAISTPLMQSMFMHTLMFSWRDQPGDDLAPEEIIAQIGHIFFEGIAIKKS